MINCMKHTCVTKSQFSIVAMKSLLAHNSGHLAWANLRFAAVYQGSVWSVVELLLIVLFIVRLCWLMAQCYVRREERLPQAHAGHTVVNPSTQPYWLTEVPPQCCCNTHTERFRTHFPLSVCAPVFRVYSSPSMSAWPFFKPSTKNIPPCCVSVWPGWHLCGPTEPLS